MPATARCGRRAGDRAKILYQLGNDLGLLFVVANDP